MSSLSASPIPLFKLRVEEKGKIRDIKEIIARIEGLPTCLNGQIVDFGDDVRGIIMGFDEQDVLALVLGDRNKLRLGKNVSGVSEPFRIPVGDRLLGRMITALGEPCDQAGPIETSDKRPVFMDSPPIVQRATVYEFLPTGTKIADTLTPLAKGQRLLILGDRMTGKTTIGADAILAQQDRNTICLYCAIGKSMSALERITSLLHDRNALDYSLIVAATDNAPVGEQYLVPYTAASVADWFASKGRDVLVVFDDLTKHAWAYRQLSLLLERPPGREAYPGDIFYVQTQLMERAGRFNEQRGGGSLTFLGIAETLQGDLTGYIPSNLASMCDGQITMSASLFAEGMRPAVDVLLSLSIIGGRAQPPALKALAADIRADFARYSEVVKLSKLQSGLSGEAEQIVRRGQAILTVFQQNEHQTVGIAELAILLYALRQDALIALDETTRKKFVREVFPFALAQFPDTVATIEEKPEWNPDVEQRLAAIVNGMLESLGANASEAPEAAEGGEAEGGEEVSGNQ